MTRLDLIEIKFKEVGLIKINQNTTPRALIFPRNHEFMSGDRSRAHGWVYLWVKTEKNNKQRFDVCYVGKAGGTLAARCDQHSGGFYQWLRKNEAKGTVDNESKFGKLCAYLDDSADNEIQLYARKSEDGLILNEDGISMCEVEERAMFKKLKGLDPKLWNKSLPRD